MIKHDWPDKPIDIPQQPTDEFQLAGLEDDIDHPEHYTARGIECIQVAEQLDFCLGNVVKYVYRAGLKTGTPASKDLKKAIWYLSRALNNALRKEKGGDL